jgi:hypothetical protein
MRNDQSARERFAQLTLEVAAGETKLVPCANHTALIESYEENCQREKLGRRRYASSRERTVYYSEREAIETRRLAQSL